jgi:hypothetical protein
MLWRLGQHVILQHDLLIVAMLCTPQAALLADQPPVCCLVALEDRQSGRRGCRPRVGRSIGQFGGRSLRRFPRRGLALRRRSDASFGPLRRRALSRWRPRLVGHSVGRAGRKIVCGGFRFGWVCQRALVREAALIWGSKDRHGSRHSCCDWRPILR